MTAPEGDFAPADPEDGREPGDWKTRYTDTDARRPILYESCYLAVLLFSAPIIVLVFWARAPKELAAFVRREVSHAVPLRYCMVQRNSRRHAFRHQVALPFRCEIQMESRQAALESIHATHFRCPVMRSDSADLVGNPSRLRPPSHGIAIARFCPRLPCRILF